MPSSVSLPHVLDHDTVTFLSEADVSTVTTGELPLYPALCEASIDVKDFVKRPIKITTIASGANTTFYPWQLWASNVAVIAKIRNFYQFRGTCVLKFVVNATPYTYGYALVGLNPDLSFGRTGIIGQRYGPFSSLNSGIYQPIDFNVTKITELKLPFISPTPYMSIVGSIGLTTLNIKYEEIFPALSVVDVAVPTPNVDVFMSVDNFELCVPTPQSGKASVKMTNAMLPEEETLGPISSIASKFVSAGNVLSTVPIIGGIAGGVSNIANVIGKVATIFGFSKPIDLANQMVMTTRQASPLTHGSGLDQSVPLSLDPKVSKSVDPLTAIGIRHDELAFASIIRRYGYVGGFLVTTANTGAVFQIRVGPGEILRSSNTWYPTPLSSIAILFSQWSGDIEYCFTISCSPFHKGRLKIWWSPTYTTTDPQANTSLITYLDLTPGASACVNIPFMWTTPSRRVILKQNDLDITNSYENNGWLFVTVDQQMVSPRPGAYVGVLVTARAGKNFSLNVPTSTTMSRVSYTDYVAPTYKLAIPTTNGLTQTAGGNYTPVAQSGKLSTKSNDSYLPEEVYGEQVVSIRQLLKRYSMYNVETIGVNPNEKISFWSTFQPRMPRLKTLDADGIFDSKGFNYIGYFAPMFAFESGSTRWKVYNHNSMPAPTMELDGYSRYMGSVYRGIDVESLSATTIHSTTVDALEPRLQLQSAHRLSANGAVLFSSCAAGEGQQRVAEVAIPDQIGTRMNLTSSSQGITGYLRRDVGFYTVGLVMGTGQYVSTTTYVAAGDDFSLYYYIGTPHFYTWDAYLVT